MRNLTSFEETNLKVLAAKSIGVALLEPTATGLKKSILDATGPVRDYLLSRGIHDYKKQAKGPDNKVTAKAILLEVATTTQSKASLYRPITKDGDPRIWFTNLKTIANPNDIIALCVDNGVIHVFNISKIDIAAVLREGVSSPLALLINSIFEKATGVANELLSKLKVLAAQGPLPAAGTGDTAIGRTIETALSIKINSSKKPDYKGIELKSSREAKNGRENRKTLFAQVADWEASKLKSSAEILREFGYTSGENRKLYCTICTKKPNSQGLYFELDENKDCLHEKSKDKGFVATWPLTKLRERLLEKHGETFWISAKSIKRGGKEFFQLTSVVHTRSPIVTQLPVMISQGQITMDHLIKKTGTKVVEKGPLFKVEAKSLQLLFPPSIKHDLLGNQPQPQSA